MTKDEIEEANAAYKAIEECDFRIRLIRETTHIYVSYLTNERSNGWKMALSDKRAETKPHAWRSHRSPQIINLLIDEALERRAEYERRLRQIGAPVPPRPS